MVHTCTCTDIIILHIDILYRKQVAKHDHSLRMQFHWLPTCNMNSEDLNINVNELCNLFAHIIRFLMSVD